MNAGGLALNYVGAKGGREVVDGREGEEIGLSSHRDGVGGNRVSLGWFLCAVSCACACAWAFGGMKKDKIVAGAIGSLIMFATKIEISTTRFVSSCVR